MIIKNLPDIENSLYHHLLFVATAVIDLKLVGVAYLKRTIMSDLTEMESFRDRGKLFSSRLLLLLYYILLADGQQHGRKIIYNSYEAQLLSGLSVLK